MAYKKYIRETQVIDRIRVIVPREHSQRVLKEIHEDGYQITSSGPYTNKSMFPKCDDKRSLFIAERQRDLG